jgi:hypothetical protein
LPLINKLHDHKGANELIQLASVLLYTDATVEEVCRTPFAAVTLCGLFQMACDDAVAKIKQVRAVQLMQSIM